MKQLTSYILEKLHIDKEVNNSKSPFKDLKIEDSDNINVELLTTIVGKLENDGWGNTIVWDDTEEWDARDDFENFDTTSGSSIDWLDEFRIKVDQKMVAIWEIKKSKQANIENHPFVKYFKNNFEEETLYKKGGYYVKYWGQYQYAPKVFISMLEAIPGESQFPIICFVISRY